MSDFNHSIIEEFRTNGGKAGGYFEGKPLLILHHKGAKTGKETETPLMYLQEGNAYVVLGTMGGAPTNPAWTYNLRANPEVEIEVGTETSSVRAREADAENAERLFQEMAAAWPQFHEYREKTDRRFPVFYLEPR